MNLSGRRDEHYAVSRPRDRAEWAKYWKLARCEDAPGGCGAYARGWKTFVPNQSPQAQYIREKSGRHFTEDVDGDMVIFTFAPGQQCFADHEVPVEREPKLTIQRPVFGKVARRQVELNEWIDGFSERLEQRNNVIKRG